MKKIKELTKRQISMIDFYAEKWLKILLSTDRFDIDIAKPIVDLIYTVILQIDKPKNIRIVDSPYAAFCVAGLMNEKKEPTINKVRSILDEDVAMPITTIASKNIDIDLFMILKEKLHSRICCLDSEITCRIKSHCEKQNKDFVVPHIDGSFYSSFFALYDYIGSELGVNFGKDIELRVKYDIYIATAKLGQMYVMDDCCVLSQKPTALSVDGYKLCNNYGPTIEYSDGMKIK